MMGAGSSRDAASSRALRAAAESAEWCEVADMNAYLKGTMGRFSQNGISRAWNRWLEALEERLRMRQFLKRLANGGLARAWGAWGEGRSARAAIGWRGRV